MAAVEELVKKLVQITLDSLVNPEEVLSPSDYAQIVSEDEQLRKMLMQAESLCKAAYEFAGKKPTREDIRVCVGEILKDALEALGFTTPDELKKQENKIYELAERALKKIKSK